MYACPSADYKKKKNTGIDNVSHPVIRPHQDVDVKRFSGLVLMVDVEVAASDAVLVVNFLVGALYLAHVHREKAARKCCYFRENNDFTSRLHKTKKTTIGCGKHELD